MLTIYEDFGYKLSSSELYSAVKQAGFDGITLFWRESFSDAKYAPPLMASNAELYVENIHMPFNVDPNDLWRDSLNGKDITNCFLQWVEDCGRFKIPTLVVHLSYGYDVPNINETGLNRVLRIIDAAEKHNVNIAFENGHTIDAVDFILKHTDSQRAGFCYDSGHHNCYTPNDDLLSKFGARLLALHLHDNQGYINGTQSEDQHLLPYDGIVNWPTIMKKIAGHGYSESISLEVMNRGYEDLSAEEFLCLAYERANKLMSIL